MNIEGQSEFTCAQNKRTLWLPAFVALCLFLNACDVSNNAQNSAVQASDPVVLDLPIAYVERPLPVDEDGEPVPRDILDPTTFNPGALLIVKERAQANARETVITEGVFPPVSIEEGELAGELVEPFYDVKDLSISPDGNQLVFAMRAPEIEDADEDDQPTWNIWLYDFEERQLRRVIEADAFAEQGHDISPAFLPDGRIVFSSTRQRGVRAMLLDEQKPAYSALDDKRQEINLNLHVMDANGDNIRQISYNASQDLQPTVLQNGNLLFLRRDGIAGKNMFSLYTSKPDGSDVQIHYGYHSQETGTGDSQAVFYRPVELADNRILSILHPRTTPHLGGDLVALNTADFVETDQPTFSNSGAQGPAQESLTGEAVDTLGLTPSLGGYYNSAYPLYDGSGRLLVSWSQCRLTNPTTETTAPCTQELLDQQAELASPLFGLWIFDPESRTQRPVKMPDEGTMYTDPVVIAPRPVPTDNIPGEGTEQTGTLHIRSVYDIDGVDNTPAGVEAMADPAQTPVEDRAVRFLRIIKNVPIPDDDVLDFDDAIFGRSANQGMRDILGYVPVEPDGSVKFTVPANVPFTFDLVDATGKRIGRRHENWLYLRPEEERECTGCHTANSRAPHGRRDAESPTVNLGAVGGVPFPNTRITDDFGTQEADPEFGESMAEYYARVKGPRTPSMDMLFTDEWTNPTFAEPGNDIQLRYIDILAQTNTNPRDANCLPLDPSPPVWTPPTGCIEADSWEFRCRTTIDYVTHIHPLWEADRRSCDELGNVLQDQTCTSCHSRGPANAVMIPAGQLELTGETSIDQNEYITSYAELLFDDNEQELVDNALTDVVIIEETGEFETDENGELILDENGNPIPILNIFNVPVPPSMSTDGARASDRFFGIFDPDGSHAGYLSADELKLIAEWLDIGAQYYNNPFNAPAN